MLGLEPGLRLVVGIEPDLEDPSAMRVYLDDRADERYVLVALVVGESLLLGWGGQHIFARLPEDAVIYQGSQS